MFEQGEGGLIEDGGGVDLWETTGEDHEFLGSARGGYTRVL